MSNWPRSRLGDLVEIVGGGTPSKTDATLWGGDIPWVSPRDMKTWEITDTTQHLTERAIEKSATRWVDEGSVLMVVRGMILVRAVPVAIARTRVTMNQDMKAFSARRDLMLPEFLAFFLRASEGRLLQRVESSSHGTKRLSTSVLLSLNIPVPPLSIQHALVETLDRVLKNASRLRQHREDAQELGRAIIPATLHQAFKDIASMGYGRRRLEQIAEIRGGIQKTPARTPSCSPVPYLRVANVQRDHIDLTSLKDFEVSPDELARWRLMPGDVLIVEGNGSADQIGRAALFAGDVDPCVHQNHLIRLRAVPEIALGAFVNAFLNSEEGQREVQRRSTTTSGLRTLSIRRIREIEIAIPPLNIQRDTVSKIEAIKSKAQELRRQLSDVEEMEGQILAAVLTSAFEGRLSPSATR